MNSVHIQGPDFEEVFSTGEDLECSELLARALKLTTPGCRMWDTNWARGQVFSGVASIHTNRGRGQLLDGVASAHWEAIQTWGTEADSEGVIEDKRLTSFEHYLEPKMMKLVIMLAWAWTKCPRLSQTFHKKVSKLLPRTRTPYKVTNFCFKRFEQVQITISFT